MTTIFSRIVADSISSQGKRLTTMHCRYPLMVHAELLTHRVFSRNARSSRAVPVPKMIAEVMTDPVVPIHWGAAQKGMQATEECDNKVKVTLLDCPSGPYTWYLDRKEAWLEARDRAVEYAQAFHEADYHKQNVNRLLSPFLHIDTLISSTSWGNFFALRDHHMAEPHIQALAKAMKEAMADSTPKLLQPGQWHLPYVTEDDWETKDVYDADLDMKLPGKPVSVRTLIKLSVARSARISYAPFDGDASIEAELKRYNLLVGSAPLHASPAEHQATPDTLIDPRAMVPQYRRPELSGNLGPGWVQFRKTLANECAKEVA